MALWHEQFLVNKKKQSRKKKKMKRKREEDNELCSAPKVIRMDSEQQSLNHLPAEVLAHIVSFLSLRQVPTMSVLNHQWYNLTCADVVWKDIYLSRRHLRRLAELIERDVEDEPYVELATWKPDFVRELYWTNDDLDREETDNITLDTVLEDFGAPLCRGTITDQFELTNPELVTKDFFINTVKDQLLSPGTSVSELSPDQLQNVQSELAIIESELQQLSETEHVDGYYQELCRHEFDQMELYFENMDIQTSDFGQGIRVDGCSIYIEDSRFLSALRFDADHEELVNSGIQRLTRRAGIKYFEPESIPVMQEILVEMIRNVVKTAATKLQEKDLNYTQTNYTGLWDDDTSEDFENEDVDTELKINSEDIISALKENGYPLLLGHNIMSFSLEGEMQDETKVPEDLEDIEDSECETDVSEATIDNADHPVFDPSNPESFIQETTEVTDEDFIDDSALLDKVSSIDVNNLGDSLEDQLLKVSIRVHEEVYGKERAHEEKLYLKNWYCLGTSLFQHVACGRDDYVDDDYSYSGKTEQEIIAHDKQEDLAYYGNTLYDEDFSDEESEPDVAEAETQEQVDGTEYHLRRLLRQESLKCIQDYFPVE